MDPPTHGLLGAVVGQAFFTRSLGRRALAWGAALNMLPDVDVVVIPLLGELAEWRYHRGVTHALWFGPLVGTALGWAIWRGAGSSRGAAPGPMPWIALAVSCLLLHPVADAFTSYGTLLLWPSPRRFAWDAVAIVDVFFTGALLFALIVGWLWRERPPRAAAIAAAALAFLAAYEAYGLRLNARAEAEARRQLGLTALVNDADVHAYPVLVLPWLRRVVVRDGERIAVGWVSTWRSRPVRWHSLHDDREAVVDAARRREEVRMFEWFAMGQTKGTAFPAEGGRTIEIDDLRYGFPTHPEHGLWGIRAELDETGGLRGPVARIQRPRPEAAALARWLWRANFGDDGTSRSLPSK
jgi:inner membrane protein